MALLFLDSFDHYATADLTQKGWTHTNGTIGSGTGRNSTNSLRITATGFVSRIVSRTVVAAGSTDTFFAGFGFYSALNTAPVAIIEVVNSGTNHVGLYQESSGVLTVRRGGSAGTLLGTCSSAITASTYYYIEFSTLISDTVGTVVVRLNGSEILNLSGVDTRNGGTGSWTGFWLVDYSVNTLGWDTRYDDFYVCDSTGSTNNTFLGPIRVKAALPDGAGTYTDFTPSAGSNYQNVDEASTDGDTTYNSSTTPGNIDTYGFAALGITGTVLAVQSNLMVRSAGSGAETIRPKIRISSTDYDGTTVGISTAYTDSREIFETSPATGVAWTVSEIDGAEFGIELVS